MCLSRPCAKGAFSTNGSQPRERSHSRQRMPTMVTLCAGRSQSRRVTCCKHRAPTPSQLLPLTAGCREVPESCASVRSDRLPVHPRPQCATRSHALNVDCSAATSKTWSTQSMDHSRAVSGELARGDGRRCAGRGAAGSGCLGDRAERPGPPRPRRQRVPLTPRWGVTRATAVRPSPSGPGGSGAGLRLTRAPGAAGR